MNDYESWPSRSLALLGSWILGALIWAISLIKPPPRDPEG